MTNPKTRRKNVLRQIPVVAAILISTVCVISVEGDTRRHDRDDVTGFVGSTHEELLSSRAHKRDIFAGRLAEMKRQMEQHKTGERLLSESEFYKVEKKIKAYEEKIEYLDKNSDLRHLDRVLMREELMNEMHKARLGRQSSDEL